MEQPSFTEHGLHVQTRLHCFTGDTAACTDEVGPQVLHSAAVPASEV